jgi:hypothetical protein
MGCGIEHLSNCHGELTGLLFIISTGLFWFKTKYQITKIWILSFFKKT